MEHVNDMKMLKYEGFSEQVEGMERLKQIVSYSEERYKETLKTAVMWSLICLMMYFVVFVSFSGVVTGEQFGDLVASTYRTFSMIILIVSCFISFYVVQLWLAVSYVRGEISRAEDDVNRLKIEISRLKIESGGSVRNE